MVFTVTGEEVYGHIGDIVNYCNDLEANVKTSEFESYIVYFVTEAGHVLDKTI